MIRVVTAAMVLSLMLKLEPNGPHFNSYGEISEAIALASCNDPLFPNRPDGAERTAAILTALAWHESRFHPNIIGDQGRSFGLWQIQPPTAKIDASLLLLPRNAAFIAIDLIRQSMMHCRARPWGERLSWYAASASCDPPNPKVIHQSLLRMQTADKLYKQMREANGAHPLLLAPGTP